MGDVAGARMCHSHGQSHASDGATSMGPLVDSHTLACQAVLHAFVYLVTQGGQHACQEPRRRQIEL